MPGPHQHQRYRERLPASSRSIGYVPRGILAIKAGLLGILLATCMIVSARPTLVLPLQNQTFEFMGFTSGMTVNEVCDVVGIPDLSLIHI